jgi:signal transduction histidine kinase
MATERNFCGKFFRMIEGNQSPPVGQPMVGVRPDALSARAARTMEAALRKILENPSRFSYGALAVSVAFTSLRGFASLQELGLFAAEVLAFAGWIHLWVKRRAGLDPTGRRPVTILLAFLGILLLSTLAARDLLFTLVAVSLLPQYFTYLPLPVAALSFTPMFVASEYSHTMAVLSNPNAFPWGMMFIRGFTVVVIGICFKVFAMQIEERSRLLASLASAERKAGVLEERQRLAREIHDTLAQGFASIIVHLERTEQLNHLDGSPAKGHIDLARSVAREGLEEARRMMAALRPEILEQRALPEALGRVCEEWSRRTGIESKLSITGTPEPMHPEIEFTILRGVQEGLTNVARHSAAHTTAVTLSYMEDLIVLDVQDDGKGFVPSAGGPAGYGLHGMRERVEGLQGSLQVESVLGEGTTISLTLPTLRPAGGEPPAGEAAT